MTGAVQRGWRWFRPANRVWLAASAATIVALIAISLLAGIRTERIARTGLGLTFGILAFTCMLIATAYAGRKRWRPLVAQRSLGGRRWALRKRRRREARISEARTAILELQADISRRSLADPAEIIRRAGHILRSAKASHMLRAELETERDGANRIWLLPKEPPGNLENWLLAHSYLGFLAVLLVGLHSGFRFGGVVAMLGVVLAGIVGVSGLVGSVLYLVIPRALGRIRNPLLPPEIRVKIAEVERAMANILNTKSGPFQEMFLFAEHELSEEDIAKVEDEEKAHFRQIFELQAEKRSLAAYLARHLRYQRYLEGWLYVHVPAATFLLTVVLIHIWSILYY